MLKYVGLLLIFITSVLIGLFFTERLNNRIIVLKSIKAMLYQFKIDITYRMPTLIELFSQVTDVNIIKFTNNISENLRNGLTPEDSVAKGSEFAACMSVLSENERYLVINTCSSIGTSDTDGQISLLENAIEQLEFYIENAIDNKNKNSKVCLTASIYTGLALIIILI